MSQTGSWVPPASAASAPSGYARGGRPRIRTRIYHEFGSCLGSLDWDVRLGFEVNLEFGIREQMQSRLIGHRSSRANGHSRSLSNMVRARSFRGTTAEFF